MRAPLTNRIRFFSLGALITISPIFLACGRAEPPSLARLDGGGMNASVAPLVVPFDAAGATPAEGQASAAGSGLRDASAPDAGPDPSTLPQTEDKPSAHGAAFDARVAAMWDAIASDDPNRAMPFFFPLGAYKQVKAIGNPESDWRRRLVANFTRDIHALHARLGADAANAKFVRIEVPEDRARWVDPGEEYNKLGYYRVYGTRIYYENAGKMAYFDMSSLISWRGEWYVVHLSGFK